MEAHFSTAEVTMELESARSQPEPTSPDYDSEFLFAINQLASTIPILQKSISYKKEHVISAVKELKSLLPKIQLQGSKFHFKNDHIELKRMPMMLRLFKAFDNNPTLKLNREDLVRRLYSCENFESKSKQYQETIKYNAVKLVSRGRRLIKTTFRGEVDDLIEWFPYDEANRVWKFYHIKVDYLLRFH